MKNVKLFAKVTFFLKEPNAEKDSLIYAFLHFNKQQLKLSTGKKIHPRHWDSDKQRAKRGTINEYDINQRLQLFTNQINTIYNKLLHDNIEPTKEIIKQAFLSNNFFKEKQLDFWEIFNQFIETYTFNGIRPTHRTIQRYWVLYRNLKEYVEKKKINLTFDKVNLDFANNYITYLTNRNLTKNSVGTYIKNLKLLMRWCADKNYHNNFEFRKFKVFKTETHQVALDDEEIGKLQELDLKLIPYLDRSRDMFLLQCNIGLRYSDMKRLKNSHINLKEGFIEIVSTKTHTYQLIPLSSVAIEIMKKYENQDLPLISNQKQNTYIKKVCEKAGINKPVSTYKEIGSKLVEEVKPKYELIGTHTARRTFITKMKMMGIPNELIKISTGHKTDRELNRYFNASLESVKKVYKELWKNI